MTNISDSQQRDREILTSIVKEMAESMTGAQSTKHWAEDALFIHGHFHPRRHLMAAITYRAIRSEAFSVWRQETCAWCVA